MSHLISQVAAPAVDTNAETAIRTPATVRPGDVSAPRPQDSIKDAGRVHIGGGMMRF